MKPIKRNCSCPERGTTWTEQASDQIHRYRVTCSQCGKFAKWGSEAELHQLVETRVKVAVVPYDPLAQPKIDTLDEFFSD